MKHNRANCEHLAALVIAELGLEMSLAYAARKLVEHYQNNPEAFMSDADAMEAEGIESVEYD